MSQHDTNATTNAAPSANGVTPTVGRSVGVAAAMLAVSALLSRILGLAREMVIANFYATESVVDAYRASFTLPDLLAYFIAGGALSITFVPMFTAYMARDDEEGGWRLFSTVVSTMGLVLVGFTLLGEVFAPVLVPLLAPGFRLQPDTLALAITMTRIVIPAQLAFYLGGILQSTLFTRGVFWPAAVAPLIYNAGIIIGGVALKPWLGIQGFSYGVLLGAILGPLAVPLWAARRHIQYRWHFSPTDPGFREYLLLSLPLMIGVSLVTVDEWLCRYFASGEEGAIAQLSYARTLMMVLFAILGQATGQAALPYLSRLFQDGKPEAVGALLMSSAQRIVFFALVASAGLMACARPLVEVVYGHGRFSNQDAAAVASLLVPFAAGLTAWSLQAVVVRGYYARKDTVTPMVIGSVVACLAIPLYWGLYRLWGPYGLAVAGSLGISVNALTTLVVYRGQGHPLDCRPLFGGIARGLVFAVACGVAARLTGIVTHKWIAVASLDEGIVGSLLMLGAMSSVFAVAACFLALVLRPPELDVFTRRAGRLLGRQG